MNLAATPSGLRAALMSAIQGFLGAQRGDDAFAGGGGGLFQGSRPDVADGLRREGGGLSAAGYLLL
jgi:hypothetical protein